MTVCAPPVACCVKESPKMPELPDIAAYISALEQRIVGQPRFCLFKLAS